MIPQELSNSLWAAAKLQDEVPKVLQVVPAVAGQIPGKASQMIPQHLSSCLFAAMRLADAVPEVLEAVPSLVKEVPGRIEVMNPQELANSLEALVVLEERLPALNLGRIPADAAVQLKRVLPEVKGKDFAFTVPVVVWACAKAERHDAELLAAVVERFVSGKSIESLPDWGVCALTWAYRRLDEKGEFSDWLGRLESEISDRGLDKEEVLAGRRRL